MFNKGWCPPPAALPPPRDGDVHLWVVRLEIECVRDGASRTGCLSRSEQERMARFRDPADGERFAQARAFLRRILGRYLELPPERVPLTEGGNGKPTLAVQHGPPSIGFNLAHSGALAVCGLSGRSEIGVDLEAVRDMSDLDSMIRRCLTADEREEVMGLDQADHLVAFYRFWTRKEAYLKGLGVGLSLDPSNVCVRDPENPRILASPRPDALKEEDRWTVRDIVPAPGYLAAVALSRPPEALLRFIEASPGSPC
jgi:4'-phosphopantetheinyl transferase